MITITWCGHHEVHIMHPLPPATIDGMATTIGGFDRAD